MIDPLEKSKSYVQVVLGIGYLALFSTWSFATPFLSSSERALAGLTGGISVLCFVIYEVVHMFMIFMRELKSRKEENKEGIPKCLVDLASWLTPKILPPYYWFWVIIWVTCTFTGLVSSGVILCAFVRNLLKCCT